MHDRLEPGIGKTRFWVKRSSLFKRVVLIGTRSADRIRASGSKRRINRPDT